MIELTYNERRSLLAAANRIREGLMKIHEFHCRNEPAYEELIGKLLEEGRPCWIEVMKYADSVTEFSDQE